MEGCPLPNSAQDIERIRAEFQECQRLLTALGDETRQYLVCILLKGDCRGSRVIEMAQQTNLSRPAISHHMQILKESGIVRARREGTPYILLFGSSGQRGGENHPAVYGYQGGHETSTAERRRIKNGSIFKGECVYGTDGSD
ncbi:MAG: metalloregulator ArsR/SmtB family transcription factor [Clostridia bacterium]|nr:metalloregulator ArsR/SmtB family transcription factor [Clostridia bacterium]